METFLHIGERCYEVDPDGNVLKDRVLEVRGTDLTLRGEGAYWVREIGENGLPFGKPEKVFAADVVRAVQ